MTRQALTGVIQRRASGRRSCRGGVLISKCAAIMLLGVSLMLGCGGKYDKPLEMSRVITMGEYSYLPYSGFEGAAGLAIAGGSLYTAFSAPPGVRAFFSNATPIPGNLVKPFVGLGKPAVIGTSRYLAAVLDQADGDTIRVYQLSGGNPIVSFSDPDWAGITGVAVDDAGNIYVSDAVRRFVRAYKPDGRPRFEVDLADSGFGIGHVMRPSGIALDGQTLLICEDDPDKVLVQRIRTDQPQTGIPFSSTAPYLSTFIEANGDEFPFVKPVGVAAGDDSSIFVLDKGLDMILRYDAQGNSIAIVNSPQSGGPSDLAGTVAIDTYNPGTAAIIYVLDAGKGVVYRWDPK